MDQSRSSLLFKFLLVHSNQEDHFVSDPNVPIRSIFERSVVGSEFIWRDPTVQLFCSLQSNSSKSHIYLTDNTMATTGSTFSSSPTTTKPPTSSSSSTSSVYSSTTSASSTTSPPSSSPISDSQAGQRMQVIAATNKTVSADAVYSVMAQLFSNKTSSNPISITAPSLSLTAYDFTRSTTVVQIQTNSKDKTNGATAAISLSLLNALSSDRASSGQPAPAVIVFMQFRYHSGGFAAAAPSNLSAGVYGYPIVMPTENIRSIDELMAVGCLFYNETIDSWRNDGCDTERNVTSFEVTCLCDHLTNFTVGSPPIASGTVVDGLNSKSASPSPTFTIPIIIGDLFLDHTTCIDIVSGIVAGVIVLAVVVEMNEISLDTVDATTFVTLGEKLGEGRYSIVYRGLQSGITHVAVKKMSREGDKRRIHNEVSVLKSLHHPNVVQYLSHYNDHGGDVWILFELMEHNLSDVLHVMSGQIDLSPRDLYNIMLQIARALSYLESAGIIHTNLSAKNVLIKGEIAKLSGFGDAVRTKSKEETERLEEDAPEVISRREYSFASDIWSFGVLFWEVMNDGQIPYNRMGDQEMRDYVMNGGRLVSKGEEPHVLIMQRCWNEDPKERIASKDIVDELQMHCPDRSWSKRFINKKSQLDLKLAESDNIYHYSPHTKTSEAQV
ncbi:Src protein [Planoprotostelium fungivorum]|uniref:Src protein n=1 Tax=Planoprotostelium fungivorum TaxID=1890364 RepID=A0A2P6MUL3_9EUKA|nr:Src protein [Planoprotostelium fungivorum]